MQRRKHLLRLEQIWIEQPIFFVTTCSMGRRADLAEHSLHAILREEWITAQRRHGWVVGRYVVMPDHVRFFCSPQRDECDLSLFVGKWKEWTAKRAAQERGLVPPLWQKEFFDHVLRTWESYQEKWEYVRQNPVRANLAAKAEDWPYQGELNDLRFG